MEDNNRIPIRKRLADPVHGTIGLTPAEVEVIGCGAFQRLRNIKQLGLAYLVYPGADYSRFAHSVGVCHVTGRILDAVRQNVGMEIPTEEIQLYRLAALLHDVGHYPFSHAIEEAAENYYKGLMIKPKEDAASPGSASHTEPFYDHERVGKEILKSDSCLTDILSRHGYSAEDLYSIIRRENPPRFANLVSSDLDADRIDYLLRTAHHTGLPYGTIDLNYLLSQMCLDAENRICLTVKALRTADHFLLSRYFDYQQVSFHKAVASLELVLKDVLKVLISESYIDCSPPAISSRIHDGTWRNFDDAFIVDRIRNLQAHTDDPVLKLKTKALIERIPPKLIVDHEALEKREPHSVDAFRLRRRLLVEHVPRIADKFGLDQGLWYVWDKPGITLTKVASHVAFSAIAEEGELNTDKYQQSVRILDTDGKTSHVITDIPHSLMSALGDTALYALRLYLVPPDGDDDLIDAIRKEVKADLAEIPWK